jgi:hypothetical protein
MRRRRPDPSGISKTQSRPSDDRSQSYWPEPSSVAHAAKQCDQSNRTGDRHDAVELGTIVSQDALLGSPNTPRQGADRRHPFLRYHLWCTTTTGVWIGALAEGHAMKCLRTNTRRRLGRQPIPTHHEGDADFQHSCAMGHIAWVRHGELRHLAPVIERQPKVSK